ncbi:hypothetical protein AB4865_07500 [Capnocytophaga sp. ARDL2]|uniref:hypothetical protein n=1 Tax=Capnocytophaga sp. ARDL2 TaxID=3238809 RepID=UPI003557F72C
MRKFDNLEIWKYSAFGLLLIAYSLLLFSCSTKKKVETDQTVATSSVQSQETKQQKEAQTVVVRDTVFVESYKQEAVSITQAAKRNRIEKKREYYESGTLKREIEVSVSENEILQQLTHENHILKQNEARLKEELKQLEQQSQQQASEQHSTHTKQKLKQLTTTAKIGYTLVAIGIVLALVLFALRLKKII